MEPPHLPARMVDIFEVSHPGIMIPDFTPPVLGSKKIANFTVYMSLGMGGWAYGLALVLVGATAWSMAPQRALPQPRSG